MPVGTILFDDDVYGNSYIRVLLFSLLHFGAFITSLIHASFASWHNPNCVSNCYFILPVALLILLHIRICAYLLWTGHHRHRFWYDWKEFELSVPVNYCMSVLGTYLARYSYHKLWKLTFGTLNATFTVCMTKPIYILSPLDRAGACGSRELSHFRIDYVLPRLERL